MHYCDNNILPTLSTILQFQQIDLEAKLAATDFTLLQLSQLRYSTSLAHARSGTHTNEYNGAAQGRAPGARLYTTPITGCACKHLALIATSIHQSRQCSKQLSAPISSFAALDDSECNRCSLLTPPSLFNYYPCRCNTLSYTVQVAQHLNNSTHIPHQHSHHSVHCSFFVLVV